MLSEEIKKEIMVADEQKEERRARRPHQYIRRSRQFWMQYFVTGDTGGFDGMSIEEVATWAG